MLPHEQHREATMKPTPKQVIRWTLGALAVIAFFVYLLRLDLTNAFQQRLADLMIGALLGYVGAVFNYYFTKGDE